MESEEMQTNPDKRSEFLLIGALLILTIIGLIVIALDILDTYNYCWRDADKVLKSNWIFTCEITKVCARNIQQDMFFAFILIFVFYLTISKFLNSENKQ
jgi:hypothetical protein